MMMMTMKFEEKTLKTVKVLDLLSMLKIEIRKTPLAEFLNSADQARLALNFSDLILFRLQV